jgi:rhodanese-related sulfurtransferase
MNLTKHLRAIAYVIFGLLSLTQLAWAVGSIEPKAAAAKVKAGTAVIIDVREAEEVKDGKAEPAIWLATSEIKSQNEHFQKVLKDLDPKKEVIIYCAAGGRAGKFAKDLEAKGFKTSNMGGFSSWKNAGLPVVKP